MNEKANGRIELTINRDAVAAPVNHAAVVCREIVDFCFNSISSADLSKRPPAAGGFFRFDPKGPDLNAHDRRNLYENWILAKAFQDLMRGVRGSLEEAYFITQLISQPIRVSPTSTLDELFAPFRERVGKKRFPDLLKRVNASLTEPVDFSDAFESMQAARNCLEHRNGVVSRIDTIDGQTMKLTFPRAKLFYFRNGEEVEVVEGEPVDAHDGKSEVEILMRLEVRERTIGLGQRIVLTARDFDELALGCFLFGSQLAARLPQAVHV
jgi:hypothetical protein